MNITPVFNTPNFSSIRRTTYKNVGTNKEYVKPYYSPYEDVISHSRGENPSYSFVKIVNSNLTHFFRDDIPSWAFLVEKLDKTFENVPKVNVYDFGCSDGSEAYTFIISLFETLGEEKAQKFLPIKAYDKDGFIVKKANSGRVECSPEDYEKLLENTNNNIEKYFEIEKEDEDGTKTLKPKEILTDNVTFEKKNYADGLENVEKENSLILSRNFLKYLDRSEIVKATYLLRDLDQSSRVVLGGFDTGYRNSTPAFMELAGFENCGSMVYRPKAESERINREVMPEYRGFFVV